MICHYLKFADEAEAIAALSAYRSTDETGLAVWRTSSHTHVLDVVGTLYKPTGVMLTDAEGNQYPEQAPLPGFHVNLLVEELPAELATYAVTPATPMRVFA